MRYTKIKHKPRVFLAWEIHLVKVVDGWRIGGGGVVGGRRTGAVSADRPRQ